jgi:hypothetical protein
LAQADQNSENEPSLRKRFSRALVFHSHVRKRTSVREGKEKGDLERIVEKACRERKE